VGSCSQGDAPARGQAAVPAGLPGSRDRQPPVDRRLGRDVAVGDRAGGRGRCARQTDPDGLFSQSQAPAGDAFTASVKAGAVRSRPTARLHVAPPLQTCGRPTLRAPRPRVGTTHLVIAISDRSSRRRGRLRYRLTCRSRTPSLSRKWTGRPEAFDAPIAEHGFHLVTVSYFAGASRRNRCQARRLHKHCRR
jgi:hypothetical protein